VQSPGFAQRSFFSLLRVARVALVMAPVVVTVISCIVPVASSFAIFLLFGLCRFFWLWILLLLWRFRFDGRGLGNWWILGHFTRH
jgi:hypothetical protein